MIKIWILSLFLLIDVGFAQTGDIAKNTFADPQPLPGSVFSGVFKEVDRSGTQITNVLFDLIDDLDLYNYKKNDFSAKFRMQRTVFDNQDIMSTWTVSDRFYLNIGTNTEAFTFPLVPGVTTPVAFNVGVGGQLLINHIRQVSSSKYHELPPVEDTEKELTENTDVFQQKKNRWYDIDPSVRPRINNILNPVFSIFKLPFTKEGLGKIASGDLISYSTSGFVSVGLQAGLIPLQIRKGVDFSVAVGVQTIVKGEFRVTVLKEDDRFVRVKLTKMRSLDWGITAGGQTNNFEVFEGFMIFEGQKLQNTILQGKLRIIPFKFSFDKETKKQWDIGYRFDLNDPDAELAYEKAIRGNFFYAEQLSQTNKAVTSILTRESLEKRRTTAYRLGMEWMVQLARNREKKDLVVTIEKDDAERHIFKSSFQLSKSWSTVWGTGEKKNFLFTTVMDEDAFVKKEDNSFQLVSEALIEDVRTSMDEMQEYIRDVESVIGDTDVIPELPILAPTDPGSHRENKHNFGRSSFYFGQYLSQKQVLKFIMTPPLRAWEIANKSFDYIKDPTKANRVKTFYKNWMSLQKRMHTDMTVDEMRGILADLRAIFKYHNRAIHVMRALLMSLNGEEIDFFLTATNQSFGRIQFRGRITTNAEKLLLLADETIDFESRVGNRRPDPMALITDLKATSPNPQEIRLSFNLPKDAKFIYFKILRTSGWKKVKVIKDLIYLNNKGRFVEGPNTWVLKAGSVDPLEKMLFDVFKSTDYYTFQMSASLNRTSWGRVGSSRFRYVAPPTLPENKDQRDD